MRGGKMPGKNGTVFLTCGESAGRTAECSCKVLVLSSRFGGKYACFNLKNAYLPSFHSLIPHSRHNPFHHS